ncbi:Glutamine--tRNA ligase protein virJ [Fulvia fulva]|uniref:glutamine--tRNA ligase n=1 Tax=Passalora fulva TaxID=5499 RepID=A0A9Q8LB02_PASFU|nr:Glutamine--tRNA ligase protein virJ [Fulvia fulva]KAK4631231.1 Glutamine--tRNA ligase protein virJ [Fulvia fulva]KAK4632690.1 Glutamine--tRNA ligase protein virJ [Fulvia fulva]UJO14089.1 Glutamine--tRNA ligase protein virJ [Fulvia fulva]WPV11226.1 Glutamine--tRNA ligase protein virJ [Fulvia fulva]WPV25583.1 Glutamine--tRNA ligase protein virJ [Fulvia fulva]
MADAAEKGPSKRALEKEAKKAAAKAAKAAAKANNAPTENKPKEAVDPFKTGWLKGVYNEKPVADVQTRFPPEPNGYLHIGHAKAITVNFGFAKSYGGKCNLRFDDTNPAKEEEQFFTSIKDMVSWLGFEPARITHSSDDFDRLYELAEELIRRGKAYVCFCSAEAVKAGRGGKEHGPRSVCEHWSHTPEKNLEEFRAMRDNKYDAGVAVLRMKQYLGTKSEEYEVNEDDTPEIKKEKAKLKALADNPALWDVAAYRIKKENYHHRTGDKWRIYPTYEFTHCLCDSFEGITHSLCTAEFETLRPAYNWLLEALDHKLPGSDEKGPMQREYGRLNVEGTILSKRRIAMLVNGATVGDEKPDPVDEAAEGVDGIKLEEEGDEEPETTAEAAKAVTNGAGRKIPPVVRDWNDPRLFTLVALRRRGVPPGALKKFVLDLGVTKANANTMTHSLDSTIRTYLERTVPRLMLVLDPIKVVFDNLPDDYIEEREVPFDPKDAEKGTHKVPFTKIIYIDRDDFREVDDPDFFRLSPGQSVGLLNAEHPIKCISFTKDDKTGKVNEIRAEYGQEVKLGKARIHWVGESALHKSPIKAECRIFNALFKTSKPNELDWKNGGYYEDVNPESEVVFPNAMVECGFLEIKVKAPWPKTEGESDSRTADKSSVRFQGLRTAFFAEDSDSTADKVILNRIVSLKEDTGKK